MVLAHSMFYQLNFQVRVDMMDLMLERSIWGYYSELMLSSYVRETESVTVWYILSKRVIFRYRINNRVRQVTVPKIYVLAPKLTSVTCS